MGENLISSTALAKKLERVMSKNLIKAEPSELMIGDYVTWNSSGGAAYGRIVREVTEGTLGVPGTDFTLEASEENPAYLIRLYSFDEEDQEYEETDTYVGHRADALSRISNLIVDNDDDEEEEDDEEEMSYDMEITEEAACDNDLERANVDDVYLYLSDRMAFEKEEMESNSIINEGDFVMWEAAGNIYKGRVLKITTTETVQSSAGLKLEGKEDDPAVLVRLFREDEKGELIESDLKAVHRMSTLQKMPKPASMFVNKPEKSNNQVKESKSFAFNITETKEMEIDGIKYGIVRGYASTYGNVDRGNDKVITGAFSKSIARYKQNNRPIKMYFNHDSNEIIGGFPVAKIQDDSNGLYVEGQINLEVQKGREAYALAKQGVMQDFSIGYTVEDYDMKNGVRELKQLELWEISMVGEPMNTEARILSVKNNQPKQFKLKDVKAMTSKRDLEKLLRESGLFSKKAAVYLSSLLQINKSDSSLKTKELKELYNLINFIKGKK